MATLSKSAVGSAKEKRHSVRTLCRRIQDKPATYLRELGPRESNPVWNYVNDLSFIVFQCEHRFPSGYDLQKYTNGALKEKCACIRKRFRPLPPNRPPRASSARK